MAYRIASSIPLHLPVSPPHRPRFSGLSEQEISQQSRTPILPMVWSSFIVPVISTSFLSVLPCNATITASAPALPPDIDIFCSWTGASIFIRTSLSDMFSRETSRATSTAVCTDDCSMVPFCFSEISSWSLICEYNGCANKWYWKDDNNELQWSVIFLPHIQ